MKKILSILSVFLILSMNIVVFADTEYNSANRITEDTNIDSVIYKSSIPGQNALLVEDGNSIINSISLNKMGDYSEDKNGINSGILVSNGTLSINGGIIKTDGKYSNAVVSNETGIININNTSINTSEDNSNGIMAYEGNITTNNVNVNTTNNYSCAIKSDKAGKIRVDSGTYKTNGAYSPVIYATSDITINNAILESKHSEGIIVNGSSVTLSNAKLIDNHDIIDGKYKDYKNIYLFSDEISEIPKFNANDSEIITNNGYTFYTDTNAQINLINNKFINNNDQFLKIVSKELDDDVNVILNLNNQKLDGNIEVDNSSLNISLINNSVYRGAINSNESKNIVLKLDLTSKIILTNDIYINDLINEVSNNSNIYLNGYNLYVNGNQIDGNKETYKDSVVDIVTNYETDNSTNYPILIVVIILSIIIVLISIVLIKKNRERFM